MACAGKRSTPSPRLIIGVHISSREIRKKRQRAGILGGLSAVRRAISAASPSVSKRAESSCSRPAHRLVQLCLAQRGHVDLLVRLVKGRIVLQRAEEIRAQAHQRAQPRIAEALGQQRRKTPALTFLGPHVELFALIDVNEEGRRLGLIELLVAPFRGIEQIVQRAFLIAQNFDPSILPG